MSRKSFDLRDFFGSVSPASCLPVGAVLRSPSGGGILGAESLGRGIVLRMTETLVSVLVKLPKSRKNHQNQCFKAKKFARFVSNH